jgi:hypothetical protein
VIGARAQVADTEDAAGERVDRRAISRPGVGDHALDSDAIAAEEANGAAEEGDRGLGALVAQHLVVDADVDVFPADRVAHCPARPATRVVVLLRALAPALAGATLDPAELLDVDVDELARAHALVALGRLEPEAAEPAHPDPRQDPGDGRLSHPQHLGDLGAGHAQAPERCDHLDPPLIGAVVDALGGGAAVKQSSCTLVPEAADPLAGRAAR